MRTLQALLPGRETGGRAYGTPGVGATAPPASALRHSRLGALARSRVVMYGSVNRKEVMCSDRQ